MAIQETDNFIASRGGTNYRVPGSQMRQFTGFSVTTTSVNKTLQNKERCAITEAGRVITLPATPLAGWEVAVTIAGTFLDTVVARNGSNIMSLAEDITIDREEITISFYYVDGPRGWRII